MTEPRPVIVVTGRHRPHEVTFLLSFVVFGAVYLAGAPPSGALARIAHDAHWLFVAWAGGLLAGGGLGLAGCYGFRRNRRRGLLLEAGGMLISAGSLILYAAGAFNVGGIRSLVGSGFGLVIAVANVWRVMQIRADLRAMEQR